MNTWAAPGVQCVCINDDWGYLRFGSLSLPTRTPMINEVLTVKHLEMVGDTLSLTFEEIEERQIDCIGLQYLEADIWWHAHCFRPLEKRKTDISCFTSMLTPAGRVPVDA